MRPNSRTRLLGVMGHPIEHSLSPDMHNAAFEATGMGYVYVAMDVRPENLADAVRGARALGFRGFNVTMPHKAAILPLLDEVDEAARISGAVNTVVVEGEHLRGMNTDGSGFVEACREAGVGFAGSCVLVVGAGGAASAICVAVLGEGAAELRIANRTVERARALKRRLLEGRPGACIETYPAGEVAAAAEGASVLINTTYLGMKNDDPLPIPEGCIGPSVAVCDAVYRAGGETRLVRIARERGARTVGGERMLLYQGVQAQRAWTGAEPDVEAMSDALS